MLNINTNIIDSRLNINQSIESTLIIEYATCELEVKFNENVKIDIDFNDVNIESIDVNMKAILLSDNGSTTFNLNKKLENQIEQLIVQKIQNEYLQLTA
ncbi:hypothetical protein [Algoriella sp.]|uniref:hypothetical protein n=1 Tax=Algoriella sp. TaxID=1872434 RepID=UPI002FC7805B